MDDCGRISDGAAAIVLATEPFARDWAARRGIDMFYVARLLGWGHRSAPIMLADKLRIGVDQPYLFPHLRAAITDAYSKAGITGPDDLNVIETHDCFTITEYVALDHFGITDPGGAWKAILLGPPVFGWCSTPNDRSLARLATVRSTAPRPRRR